MTLKTNNKIKIVTISLIVLFLILLLNIYRIATFVDEIYVPERLNERKVTFGDKEWSKNRKVFIKDLNYISSIELKYFNVYIEKGFWFNSWDRNKSVFNKNTNYPYQISFSKGDTIIAKPYSVFKIVNTKKFDSIDNELLDGTSVYLKNAKLQDTLLLKIIKFDGKRDSIGFVKIWE